MVTSTCGQLDITSGYFKEDLSNGSGVSTTTHWLFGTMSGYDTDTLAYDTDTVLQYKIYYQTE